MNHMEYIKKLYYLTEKLKKLYTHTHKRERFNILHIHCTFCFSGSLFTSVCLCLACKKDIDRLSTPVNSS